MEVVRTFFVHLFSQVWRVLSLNMPVFDIPIWSVWVGIFTITLSIKILRNFLGLTGGIIASEEVSRWYNSKPYPRKSSNTSIARR